MNSISFFIFTVSIILLTIGFMENNKPTKIIYKSEEKKNTPEKTFYEKQFDTSLTNYNGLFNINDSWMSYPYKYNHLNMPKANDPQLLNIPNGDTKDTFL